MACFIATSRLLAGPPALLSAPLYAEVIEDALGGGAPFMDRGDHQIGAAHHVTASEDFRVAGLELVRALLGCDNAALGVGSDIEVAKPGRRAGAETEGNHHRVGRQDLLGTGDRLRTAPTTGIRCAEAGFDDFHAF